MNVYIYPWIIEMRDPAITEWKVVGVYKSKKAAYNRLSQLNAHRYMREFRLISNPEYYLNQKVENVSA